MNIEWIFEHSEEVLAKTSVEMVNTLGESLGLKLYGDRLDYISWHYYEAMPIMFKAREYLENKDLQGWLNFCEEYKSSDIGKENAKRKIDEDYKSLAVRDYYNLDNRHWRIK